MIDHAMTSMLLSPCLTWRCLLDAIETFVVELGRAHAADPRLRGSRYLRGLSAHDREDVIAAAIAWCWEHREEFDRNEQPLDVWFAKQLRIARQSRTRVNADGSRSGKEFVSVDAVTLVADDDTPRAAEAQLNLASLKRTLTGREQRIVDGLGEGWSPEEIAARIGISRKVVRTLQRRLDKLRDLLPYDAPMISHTELADIKADAVDKTPDNDKPPTAIDRALAELSDPPRYGHKDCPVCWRCCWYMGKRPKYYAPSELADPELRAAVRATEERKIKIARGELA